MAPRRRRKAKTKDHAIIFLDDEAPTTRIAVSPQPEQVRDDSHDEDDTIPGLSWSELRAHKS